MVHKMYQHLHNLTNDESRNTGNKYTLSSLIAFFKIYSIGLVKSAYLNPRQTKQNKTKNIDINFIFLGTWF